MTDLVEPGIRFAGSWTDPETGAFYVQKLFDVDTPGSTGEDTQEAWTAWMPGLLAVLNSGALDKWIYEIAAQCHQRHEITNGEATSARPAQPADVSNLPLDPARIPAHQKLGMGDLNPSRAVSGNIRLYTHAGLHYPRVKAKGRYFEGPHSFNPALRGQWFRIEDFGADHFKCRVVTEPPANSGVKVGQIISVKFESVNFLFTR